MAFKRNFKKIINIILDFIFLSNFIKFYIKFRLNYIAPRINKIEGSIAANRIKNKGIDLRIHGSVIIGGLENLKIGNYVRIGKGAYFDCTGGLTIGNNVQLSRNILIYTSNHDINSGSIPYGPNYVYKPVIIGDSVWIGMNVIITPGTIIEDGAIIGMGTVVSGVVPKGAILVGAKARIVGYRNVDEFDRKVLGKEYFGFLYPEK